MHKFCWIFRFVLCFKTSRRIIFGRTYPHNWKKMTVNKESLAVINKNIFELLSTTALYRIFARDDQIWTISLVFDLHILHNKCCHSRDNWGNHGKKVKIFEENRKVSLKNSQKDNTQKLLILKIVNFNLRWSVYLFKNQIFDFFSILTLLYCSLVLMIKHTSG